MAVLPRVTGLFRRLLPAPVANAFRKIFMGVRLVGFMVVLAFGAVVLSLVASGKLTRDRAEWIVKILNGTKVRPSDHVDEPVEKRWRELAEARERQEGILSQRGTEVTKFGDLVRSSLAQVEADRQKLKADRHALETDRQALGRDRRTLEADREALEAERRRKVEQVAQEQQQKKAEEETVLANKVRYDKMEVEEVVNVFKRLPQDNKLILTYLKTFKPIRSAQVLAAMRQDPDWIKPFEGKESRFDLLVKELETKLK